MISSCVPPLIHMRLPASLFTTTVITHTCATCHASSPDHLRRHRLLHEHQRQHVLGLCRYQRWNSFYATRPTQLEHVCLQVTRNKHTLCDSFDPCSQRHAPSTAVLQVWLRNPKQGTAHIWRRVCVASLRCRLPITLCVRSTHELPSPPSPAQQLQASHLLSQPFPHSFPSPFHVVATLSTQARGSGA
jgi:hypothetical protein